MLRCVSWKHTFSWRYLSKSQTVKIYWLHCESSSSLRYRFSLTMKSHIIGNPWIAEFVLTMNYANGKKIWSCLFQEFFRDNQIVSWSANDLNAPGLSLRIFLNTLQTHQLEVNNIYGGKTVLHPLYSVWNTQKNQKQIQRYHTAKKWFFCNFIINKKVTA